MNDPLRLSAAARPDAPALDDGSRVWSYAELDAAVSRMARRLGPLGAVPGATVVLACHPSALAIQALFAVLRTGASIAVLNPRLGPGPLEAALDEVGPELLLSTARDVGGLGVDPAWFSILDDLPKPPPDWVPPGSADSERAVAILRTSGTSGGPGMVPISLAGLDASAKGVAARLGLGAEDRWYASLSIAHVGGLALVHRALHVGSCLVVRGSFSVETLATLIDDGEVTHASLVPTMLKRLVEVRGDAPVPSTLRCLLVGGARTDERLVGEGLTRGYPIALTYGLTEACSQVATAPPALVSTKPGTVGAPIDGVEVSVGSAGEIAVRGPTVVPSLADDDGWLATGDVGSLDGDGHLWITGRLDERIISGGVNVDPRRVEEALLEVSGVVAAVVVGLPDPTWGEVVGALIVASAESLDPESVVASMRGRVSSAELPRKLAVVAELPQNANGKIDPAAVRGILTGI